MSSTLGTLTDIWTKQRLTMEFFSITDWIRPMVILVCGMLLFNLPTLLYKTRLTLRSFLYLFVSKDKKWKKTPDPLLVFGPAMKDRRIKVETKMVYLVRHGESTWNDTFNKGKHRSLLVFVLGYIPGLVKAFAYETYLVLSGKMDRYVSLCLCVCVCVSGSVWCFLALCAIYIVATRHPFRPFHTHNHHPSCQLKLYTFIVCYLV